MVRLLEILCLIIKVFFCLLTTRWQKRLVYIAYIPTAVQDTFVFSLNFHPWEVYTYLTLQYCQIAGFEITRDEFTSLRRLLDNDLADHVARITEISDTASREWGIEKALDKMVADWQGLQL